MNVGVPNVNFAASGWPTAESSIPAAPVCSEPAPLLDQRSRVECEAQISSAFMELVSKLARADNLRHACMIVVGELQEYFECQRVALALRRSKSKHCQLAAVSDLAQFDPRSEFVQAMEAALDECLLCRTVAIWPAESDGDRPAALAHRKLATLVGSDKIVSIPLLNGSDETIGALAFMGNINLNRPAGFQAFLQIAQIELGKWIDLVARAEPGLVQRQCARVRGWAQGRRGRLALVAIALLGAILAMPQPYKIKCNCEIQPVTRRFVAAPFDGRLEKSLVRQGDLVQEGQVLARLDGREIRWELAGLVADRNRAGKQRDSAMASGKVGDAQAAKLEMDRLDLKIQLLHHRTENLEIRSPIDGIVISGDLDRTEGAPLTIGQTLFEVAPLHEMLVELDIPADDIAYVRSGQDTLIRFDAYPSQTWLAPVTRIHPRSETRQSKNVFVAELTLDNRNELLRPGMNGRAKIVGPRSSVAWNLFHKPAEWLAATVGW